MKRITLPLLLIVSTCCLSSCSILDGIFGGNNYESTQTTETVTKGLVLYRSDTEEVINDGDSLEIETYYDFYFTLKYNGEEVKAKSITSSNELVIYPHSKSIYPRSEGTATLTIKYQTSSGEEITYNLQVQSVHKNTLSSIYVGNAENGIKYIGSDQVKITGKVFAKFENNIIRAINNDSNLLTTVSSGKDTEHKKVTLSYTDNGITVSTSYEVPVANAVNEIEKTELEQNFKTYSTNGVYKSYPYLESKGDINILVIPVWFTDSSNYFNLSLKDHNGKDQKEQIIEDLNDSLFGDPIRRREHTLKSYYLDESFGELNITGKVSDWYNSSYSSSTNYFSDSTSRNNLMKSAYDWYFNTTSESKADYDAVIYSYGSNHYGEASNKYTSFKTSIKDSSYPYLSTVIWSATLHMYNIDDGETDYMNLNDLSDNSYNDAVNQYTSIHEFAHAMGAIDVYSDVRRNGIANVPAGIYSMQASNWTGHDVFNLLGLGWSNPYILSSDVNYGKDSITLTIDDIQSSGDSIILSPSWNSYNSPFDEYIALELFSEAGVNTFGLIPNNRCGVRVYHVDARLYNLNTNSFTSNANASNTILPFTNTVGMANGTSNYSQLSTYADMDAVHLIRQNKTDSKGNEIGYYTDDKGREDTWFKAGDSFSMSKYAKQFYNEGELDSGLALGWEFKINSITQNDNGGASATITFTKA